MCSGYFFRRKQTKLENTNVSKLLFLVNVVTKGNQGHTPVVSGAPIETICHPTVLTPHISLIVFSRKRAGLYIIPPPAPHHHHHIIRALISQLHMYFSVHLAI